MLRKLRRWRWPILAGYALLLLVSHIVRALQPESYQIDAGQRVLTVQAVSGEQLTPQPVRLVYAEYGNLPDSERPTLMLLHGSPGDSGQFSRLAPHLAEQFHLIIPDLPGFGDSSRHIPDYSMRAHAHYMLQMLDRLNIPRAHLIAFSMGGGVALNMSEIAPQRVASITLLSSIGVQELELLGDYHINHILHGMQLAGLWLIYEGIPHMGWLDDGMLGLPYARNFYDSDQRPLRGILRQYRDPMLILHGEQDFLVPVQAAQEHHRLVPQSELHLFAEGHFIIAQRAEELASMIGNFVNRVQQGQATTRAEADPARMAQAALPFSAVHMPHASRSFTIALCIMLALATLVSEDLACIGGGVLVAQGRIDFLTVVLACFVGIFLGDMLIFLAGRFLGRPAAHHAPMKWFLREADIARASAWFTRRGFVVILLSRFIPGMRLPTYFAAGCLNTNFLTFSFYFALAAAAWTPLLVGLAAVLGQEVLMSAMLATRSAMLQILVASAIGFVLVRLLISLSSFRGRRMLLSRWRRLTRWEFWPMWRFYPPVVAYILWLGLRHRGLTVFTAANPAIPGGGFVGESKLDILRRLSDTEGYVARSGSISAALDAEGRIRQAQRFMQEQHLTYPVVLKPDVGQRGSGVAVVRSAAALESYLRGAESTQTDTIIQEYIPGVEFGVFYYRYPGEEHGHIFSITDKRFPVVVGDGTSTLERLILGDSRAVCMAKFYLKQQQHRLDDVPAAGEAVQLVELGTHSRGAIFLDGSQHHTAALAAAVDRISQRFDGFSFGRFDIRAPSVEEFRQGRFKVIELNGVTSEATHIYDPQNGLLDAYRILFAQWRIAFAIGAANRARGAQPMPLGALLRMVATYRKRSGARSAAVSPTRPIA